MRIKNVTVNELIIIGPGSPNHESWLGQGVEIVLRPGDEKVLFDEDAEKSATISALLTAGKLSKLSDEEPADGTPVDDSSGTKTFNGTVICKKDNASSFRLAGKDFGGADVQSYAGMFYNAGYDTVGVKKTRAIVGANIEMDLELQSPHALLLTAVDGGFTDGVVKARSRSMVELSARCDAEVIAPKRLSVDRVDTGTYGAANTSDVELRTNSGALHINSNGNGVEIGGCLITISGDNIIFSKAGKSVTLTMVP